MISSASTASCASTSRSVASGGAPGDQLLLDVADRLTRLEAPLGVVAGGGRDRAGPDVLECLPHGAGVVVGAAAGVEADGGGQPGLR